MATAIGILANGNIVALFSAEEIYGRTYSADGTPITDNFIVNGRRGRVSSFPRSGIRS
ncbi:MAG TPA: hypothetical protein VGB04_02165 [Allosphingosinicella sp.]|jgi:hypothetical protein